ncbi:MAG: ATP-binding cassette domain-containing protein [Myxococcota bacterium]
MIFSRETPAVIIEALSVRFGERAIISDFSLILPVGKHVVIEGESGSGKSTILKCILGFVVPEKGQILIGGEELNRENVWALRRKIGFVQQEAEFKQGSVLEILKRPFAFKANRGDEFSETAVKELFDKFKLSERLLKEDIQSLSGGEKQRVAIISALLMRRPIYLMDEVTSALDDESKECILDYFKEQKGLTILSVAHDKVYNSFADRVIQLDSNRGDAQ